MELAKQNPVIDVICDKSIGSVAINVPEVN